MAVQIAVRLPEDLLREIDRLVERHQFSNRTDAVRAALDQLVRNTKQREMDDAIAAGYTRVPDEPADAWVEASARAMVADEPW